MQIQNRLCFPRQPALDVLMHILNCQAKNIRYRQIKAKTAKGRPIMHPQLLVLAGSPGTGKTFLATEVSELAGASVHYLHGSVLGGPFEGMASDALADAYINAALDDSAFQSVLIIDDAEMGDLNTDKNTSGTSSSDLVIGMMLEIANNPFVLKRADSGKTIKKITLENPPAIILTANRTGALSEALLRAGRCNITEVDPKGPDLWPMVGAIFPQCSLTQIKQMVAAFPDETIAFFSELSGGVSKAFAERVALHCEGSLANLDFADYAEKLDQAAAQATFEDLMRAGKILTNTERSKSYLQAA